MSAKHIARFGVNHLLVCLVLIAVMSTAAMADIYTGSLSYGSGLYAQGNWAATGTSIVWTVTDNTTSWHYKYTLTVPAHNISHLIIEVSPTFTTNDVWNSSLPFGEGGLGSYSSANGNSNPGMPSEMRGLKWNFGTATTMNVEFDSDRAPVWGDFYSKDGKMPGTDIWNIAYNLGFGNPDTDPTAAIRNGSVDNHILVPDTTTVTPLPGAALLGLLGLSAAAVRLRKFV
jgi:hypothetical protein